MRQGGDEQYSEPLDIALVPTVMVVTSLPMEQLGIGPVGEAEGPLLSGIGLDTVTGLPPELDVSIVNDGADVCKGAPEVGDAVTDTVTGCPSEVDVSIVNCGVDACEGGIEELCTGADTVTGWPSDVDVSTVTCGEVLDNGTDTMTV